MLYRLRHSFFYVGIRIFPFPNPDMISGDDGLKELAERIQKDGLRKILIVTDENLVKIGLLDDLKTKLDEINIEYAIFNDVQPNPTIENVENARKMYQDEKCQGIIAFGGGSPMDCAKVAAARIVKPKMPVVKMRGQFRILKKLPPFYAIPTTSGTGSETTAAAIITNPETHEKMVIVDLALIPLVAVLDPNLTIRLPPFITATTGMDALTHAIEAHIGWHGTKYISGHAEKATKLIFENIEETYFNGTNKEARNNMAFASFHAGIAFTRASVGYIHAIAHNLGGLYDVPHGLANAVVLPYVLDAYGWKAHKKLANLAVAGGLISSYSSPKEGAEILIQKIRDLNQKMGLPSFIKEIQEKDIDIIAERAVKEGNSAYPVPKILFKSDFIELLRNIKEQ
ncbi:MAG: iron-containing alcohol dehydrogenase [Promethearchaeota archaeon]|nr:MAG: iron-containing alcohol dehydrogenase [Candidatus Lokiarchaeota archaeon]